LKDSLRKLGIIGPRHYRHLVEELRKAQVRSDKLAQELDAARTDARASKARADQVHKALREAKDEGSRQAHRVEQLTADIARVKAEYERKYEQDRSKIAETEQRRAAVVEGFTQRLADAERDLVAARDSLMTVDVKLDILEGAANVLDARTRAVGAPNVPAGGAPV
jgi:chromosome segregation ATPase